jgi:hypothetical protein
LSPGAFNIDGFELPTDIIEDLLALMQQLGALFPSGLFKPNPDGSMKDVLDFIANLLNQLAPFLSFYNFIMAALQLIVCIIEVLCAIPNPFAVASKLKRLFAECLPPFLNLFPWLALLAMILALLLLILALILYIINTIIAIILELIQNLLLFSGVSQLSDSEAALAIAAKIASLLCIIENILAILIAIAAILAVITALAQFAGLAICDDADEQGCCPPEICPPFIKNNREIAVTNGSLTYYSRIGADLAASGLPASLIDILGDLVAIRQERWQLFDTDPAPAEPISLIITPTLPVFFGSQIFYPDQPFAADTPPSRAPYTVDMTFSINPAIFGHPPGDGYREFQILDCIVVQKPYVGLISYNNFPSIGGTALPLPNGSTGTFNLEGGLVYEADGETPFEVAGQQASLNSFIHDPASTADDYPLTDDGYTIQNIEFVWKPQHPALAGFDLITVGCIPEVGLEKLTTNAFIAAEGIEAVIDRLEDTPDGELVPSAGVFPNVLGTQQCAQQAIDDLRPNISIPTVAEFQQTIVTCLTDLRDQTLFAYCGAFIKAVSQFQSSFSIDPSSQFVTRAIDVSVILRDAGGTNIMNNIPEECLDDIFDLLQAEATFGTVGPFSYDAENLQFTAELTSTEGGAGELTIIFDSKVFSDLNQSGDFDVPSSITETVLDYTFVDAVEQPVPRRDVTDTAGDDV